MFEFKRTAGMALTLGVALTALMTTTAAAGPVRAGLVVHVNEPGVVLVTGEAGDDSGVSDAGEAGIGDRDPGEGDPGEGDPGEPMPVDDDGMAYTGGDPDFCEACGGEIVEDGGEGTVEDGSHFDGEAVATTTAVETRGAGGDRMRSFAGGGTESGRSNDGCVVPQWRRGREALCAAGN
ncbi:hypothetical protein E7811_03620 [Aliigemmobacter aestuarii]|uniref:Uncharacterized protein n=1 Tax=Aliigemmobacter aestuarii TaxID=1445661 RepID=A0A4S3MQP0_9RHOB|nr:hypothetical protein [Gemmobacter aestuarii]THD84826.1 hypothetical protein E7811_03620 [Gemmobacter aestuarii]